MKVLVIDEEFPFPLNTGKRIRSFNLISRLARRHEVVYLCRENGLQCNVDIPIFIHKVQSPIPKKSGINFYIKLVMNYGSKLPYIVSSHYSYDYEAVVFKFAKEVDLIHCEWTPYAWSMRTLFPCKAVLSTHNVESQIWERYYNNEKNPVKKFYIYHQWKKLMKFEKWACNQFSHIIAVSDEDKKTLIQKFEAKNVTVVPNGVDVDYFKPQKIEIKPYNIVFTGSMDWRPNQDAVVYFLELIYPLIQKKIPDVSFTVVGRNPPDWVLKKGKFFKNVEFTGTVDDVRPYIGRSSLFVVPLRIGGGSRLKILEALAMCKPVLSTTIGAEGLKVEKNKTIFLADDPLSFANIATDILQKPEKFKYVAENGRNLVITKYNWDSIVNIMERVWAEALNSNDKHSSS